MSLDLTLIIDRWDFNRETLYGFVRIPLDHQDRNLYEHIAEQAIPLSQTLANYGDEGIEYVTTDPYGDKLTYMPAYTLAKHLTTADLKGWDKATLTFLQALPPETKIVLWWN